MKTDGHPDNSEDFPIQIKREKKRKEKADEKRKNKKRNVLCACRSQVGRGIPEKSSMKFLSVLFN